jgi:hypothetical protein
MAGKQRRIVTVQVPIQEGENSRSERQTTPQEEEDSSTPGLTNLSDIAIQQAEVQARIDQLEELNRLRIREAQLLATIQGIQTRESTPRRRRTSTSSTSSSGGEIKIRNLTCLTSNASFRKRDEWISDLQRAFAGAHRRYRKDYKKILLGLDNMDIECRARWDRYLDEQEATDRLLLENDWEKFMEWSLTLIKDSTNRLPLIARQLERARQRDHQSPSEFYIYLDSLEKHFPRATEEQRALSYYAKLQDNLQTQISLNSIEIPSTRMEMVDLATRFWDSIPRGQKRPQGKEQGSAPKYQKRYRRDSPHNRHREQERRDSGTPRYYNPGLKKEYNPRDNEKKQLRCYECHSKDHLRNTCPQFAKRPQPNEGNGR